MQTKYKKDRLFVPLASEPFSWFYSGEKKWELRRLKGQYNTKNIQVGRVVELRLGYNTGEKMWGVISEVFVADSLESIYKNIDYRLVIPRAENIRDAKQISKSILGTDGGIGEEFIAFKVNTDIPSINMDEKFLDPVLLQKKISTIREGVRDYSLGPAVLKFDSEDIPIEIASVIHKKLKDVSDDEANRDGFENTKLLVKELKVFYPNISIDDNVSIISFIGRHKK